MFIRTCQDKNFNFIRDLYPERVQVHQNLSSYGVSRRGSLSFDALDTQVSH